MEAGGEQIPLTGFLVITVAAVVIGVIFAVILARRAARPARTFAMTTVALVLASLVPPLALDTDTATKVVL